MPESTLKGTTTEEKLQHLEELSLEMLLLHIESDNAKISLDAIEKILSRRIAKKDNNNGSNGNQVLININMDKEKLVSALEDMKQIAQDD